MFNSKKKSEETKVATVLFGDAITDTNVTGFIRVTHEPKGIVNEPIPFVVVFLGSPMIRIPVTPEMTDYVFKAAREQGYKPETLEMVTGITRFPNMKEAVNIGGGIKRIAPVDMIENYLTPNRKVFGDPGNINIVLKVEGDTTITLQTQLPGLPKINPESVGLFFDLARSYMLKPVSFYGVEEVVEMNTEAHEKHPLDSTDLPAVIRNPRSVSESDKSRPNANQRTEN